MRVPPSDPQVQQAFREIWTKLDQLTGPNDVNLHGKRMTNAGNAHSGSTYITRSELRDYVRSQEFTQDITQTVISEVQTTSVPHGMLSTTHSDALASGASRGDLMMANSSSLWTRLPKGTAGQIIISDGTDPAYGTSLASLSFTTSEVIQGLNGSTATFGYNHELLSVDADPKDTTANLLPANSIILGVVARVTTAILVLGAETPWDLGTNAVSTRFATGVAGAAGTTISVPEGAVQSSAAKLRVTSGAGVSGAIRLEVYYVQFVAPTS